MTEDGATPPLSATRATVQIEAETDAERPDSSLQLQLLEKLGEFAGRLDVLDRPSPNPEPVIEPPNLRGTLTETGQARILHHVLTAVCAVVLAKFGGLDSGQATEIATSSATQLGLPAGLIGIVVGVFQWLRKDA